MPGSAPKFVKINEPREEQRRVWFDLRQVLSPLDPAVSESGGQPQISLNGAPFTATGISTLSHVGNGRYFAAVDQSVFSDEGDFIKCWYGGANVVGVEGTTLFVTAQAPETDFVNDTANQVISLLAGSPGLVVVPSASKMMTLGEAAEFCRSALDDNVQDGDAIVNIKNAIRTLADDFVNNTPINDVSSVFTATTGNPELNLASLPSFRAEYFIEAQIDFKPSLAFNDYQTVSRELDATESNGTPEMISFYNSTTAFIAPRPVSDFGIKIKYKLPANELTSDTDIIQIPANYFRPAMWYGVPALLRSTREKGDEGDRGWIKYRDIVNEIRGSGVSNRGNFVMDYQKFV